MQLFKERYSLHRVTRVQVRSNRTIALPSYTIHPGMMNRPEHFIQVYGKSLTIQYEREIYVPTILSIDQVVCSNTKGFCLKTPEVASKETAIPRKVTPAIPIALLSHAGCQRLSKICQDRV